MHISPRILRLALLRVFAQTGVGASGSLSLAEVSAAWPQTGLRQSDLRDAVREMLDSGELEGSGPDESLSLALSPRVLQDLREPHGELQLATFDDEAMLFMAQHRGRGGESAGMMRRGDVGEGG
jgi:hypothetical protein